MQIQLCIFGLALVVSGLVILSCDKDLDTGEELSKQDREFIKALGILDGDESIVLFDSQGGGLDGLKTSGNFFSDKRIASYWIDKRDTTRRRIDYAFYADIDTIWRYPKYKSWTLASFLEVHRRNGTKFKVYVDSDSARTWDFFNRALQEWNRKNAR